MSIGYACILSGEPDCRLKSLMLKSMTEDKLNNIILHNLNALNRIMDYNIKNNIKLFRISSDIIPFASHPANKESWWITYKDILSSIGTKVKSAGIRISMHPGQYTVLNSPNEDVVKRSIADLIYHGRFLDSLEADYSNKLILHIGGVYGDKTAAIDRFIKNYLRLPENIKGRLVIENDDKSYSIDEILKISEALSIPAVFDNLHHQIKSPDKDLPMTDWIKLCQKTWNYDKDGKQKIHYSQQAEGEKVGHHSQTINTHEFVKFYNMLNGLDIDIMLEVKDKNISALKCIQAIESLNNEIL